MATVWCANRSHSVGRRLQRMTTGRPATFALVALLATTLFGWKGVALRGALPESRESVASPTLPKFKKDILPIFERNCLRCHDMKVKSAGLDLSTSESVLTGGDSGPAVDPGAPDASRLYDMIHNKAMPLDRKTQVSAAEMETIRQWIIGLGADAKVNRPIVRLNQHDIIPIMLRHCAPCHGLRRQEGDLDLRTRASMLAGGKSGRALVPGEPEKSLILQKILAKEMPPLGVYESGVAQPPKADVEKLKKWIAQGAPEVNVQPDVTGTQPDPLVSDHDRQFWAFQPPRPVEVPSVKHKDRVRNPIDAFILEKLEAKGLTLSPEADRLTLIRRAYFDLTGLPPTPEEVRAFVSDQDPQAYEKLIDRLLDSPRYGERWGRYWLDLAGYADTEERDRGREHAWRYRDYVIRAFNADKPYDRFLLEQIAGDELADYGRAPVLTHEMMDNLVATGFLRLTEDPTAEAESGLIQDRISVISDEMQVFGSGVLGLTIQCAQCHDHKLEPIPQRDYYRLRAVFKGALDEYNWMPPRTSSFNGMKLDGSQVRLLPYAPPRTNPIALMEQEEARQAANKKLSAQIKDLKDALNEKAKPLEDEVVEERLAKVPRELHDDLRKMLATPPDKRNDRLRYLAEKFEHHVRVDPFDRENLLKDRFPDYQKAAEETERKILLLQSEQIPEPYVRALWDRGDPSPTYIYKRGDFQNSGRLVGPGVPSVLTDGKTPFVVTPPWPGARKTGARLALAKWLVEPDNPLTARVWVNRIWQHHFGSGIVPTVENFGRSGAPPTHPELLDWLAVQLVNQGWSTKAIHRLTMTSNTYRQSSRVTTEAEKLDPRNVLLSRMPLIRVDAEALRDSILFIAGRLDETSYGPPELLFVRHDGMVMTPDSSAKAWRRSIYLQQRRMTVLTMLDLFDYPQMGPNCSKRASTAVAPQALFLLNNTMIRALADSLAQRVRKEAGDGLAQQIDRVYWLALSRPPTVEEKSILLEELGKAYEGTSSQPDAREQLMARLCHTIINSTAFIYID